MGAGFNRLPSVRCLKTCVQATGNRLPLRELARAGLLIGVLVLVASATLLYQAVRPPRLPSDYTPSDFHLTYEEVRFQTEDGIELSGWFIPAQTEGESARVDAPTIIALHGYPADKHNILPAVAPLADDYNLFLFDFRYFGDSGGAYSGLGAHETRDLEAAAAYLETERDITEIGVWGFSLGGAVALMSAPDMPHLQAVYAESSYADLHEVAHDTVEIPVAGPVFVETAALGARALGINTREVSPLDRARQIDIPVLLVHSRDDDMIDISHGKRLEAALRDNSRARSEFETGLGHGQSSREQKRRLREFFAGAFE